MARTRLASWVTTASCLLGVACGSATLRNTDAGANGGGGGALSGTAGTKGGGGASGGSSAAGHDGGSSAGGHDGGGDGPTSDAMPATPGTILWARSGSAAFLTGVTEASTGVLVTGFTSAPASLGGALLTPAGATDGVIAEYAIADGSYLSSSRFGASSPSGVGVVWAYSIVVNPATAKPVIAGSSVCNPGGTPACDQIDVGLGLVTPGGGSGTDGFVGEYTVSTGQAVWVDRLEGPGNDYLETALANGPNNTTLVGGYFDQSTTFATSGASPMFIGGGDRDVFIAQLNSSGGIGMTKTFADPAFEEVTSLAWTGTEIVAGGFLAGMATFGSTMLSSMDFDVWIGKLAVANGAPVWTVPLGGSGPDKYPYVAVDAQGNIYAVGTVSGSATFGTYSVGGAGGLDIFVVKLRNSDGGVIWATSFGSTGDDTAAAVAINSSGELLVSGTVSGPIETGGPFAGGTDAVLAAYNGDGTRLWTKVIGSTGMDNGFGVASGTQSFYATVDLGADIGSSIEGVPIQGESRPSGVLLKVQP
jgi:hypothetical protein